MLNCKFVNDPKIPLDCYLFPPLPMPLPLLLFYYCYYYYYYPMPFSLLILILWFLMFICWLLSSDNSKSPELFSPNYF